ncbi:MAG: sugar ABC transporter ATP-binding protein [Bdellovibrionales bacterium]|nr:sugar ABC transporter ATP-binding protein [Bdellovibrionales bacterium]
MLRMHNISKSFGAISVLQKVSLEVSRGQALALLGENGAGKSTLMKILSGAYQADEGTIELDGAPLTTMDPHAARAAGVAMIYQELALVPHLTVAENILLGDEQSRWGLCCKQKMNQRAKSALDSLGHGDLALSIKVKDLPISLRQVVEIARALASGCSVLVLDEPTSSLTPQDTDRLFETIEKLKSQNIAVIYISHFLEEIFRVCERTLVLRDGKEALEAHTDAVSSAQLVEAMVGGDIAELYPRSPRTPGVPVLQAEKISATPMPHSADLALHSGEIVGIAGLVGSGRTELLESLFGSRPISTGQVQHFGTPLQPTIDHSWRTGLGFVSEDRGQEGLALSMSIAENIILARIAQQSYLVRFSKRATHEIAQHWIATLGIKCRDTWQPVGELSGGNQQKVAIARLLHGESMILLLDEPTKGIDAGSKAQIYALLDSLVSTSGDKRPAVLVTSSYLPELLGICDRVYSMYRGKVLAPHTVQSTSQQQIMHEICGGNDASVIS